MNTKSIRYLIKLFTSLSLIFISTGCGEERSSVTISGDSHTNSLMLEKSSSLPDTQKYKEDQKLGLISPSGDSICFYTLKNNSWEKTGDIKSSTDTNITTISDFLNSPAGQTLLTNFIDPKIANKADTDVMNTALGKKADTDVMNTALGKKADTDAMNTELGKKADTDKVYTKDEVNEKLNENSKTFAKSMDLFLKMNDKIKDLSEDQKNTILQKYFRDPVSFNANFDKMKGECTSQQLCKIIAKMGGDGFLIFNDDLKNLKKGDTKLDSKMGSRYFYDETDKRIKFFGGSTNMNKYDSYDLNAADQKGIGWPA